LKKRKVTRPDGSIDWIVLRPQFRQMLADLASGVIDGVIFYDLDRLVRQPGTSKTSSTSSSTSSPRRSPTAGMPRRGARPGRLIDKCQHAL
jgi:hypothetical protein